jgi:hypothetical protein
MIGAITDFASRIGARLGSAAERYTLVLAANPKKSLVEKTRIAADEFDYIMGDFNAAASKRFFMGETVAESKLFVGTRYRAIFQAEKYQAGVILPGGGLIDDKDGNTIRIIKIVSYQKKGTVEVDFRVIDKYQKDANNRTCICLHISETD